MGAPATLSADASDAEVENLHITGGGHEDLGWLQVAVHDAGSVRRLQRLRHLDAYVEELRGTCRAPDEAVLECFSFEQLHDEEVLSLALVEFLDCADTRMPQPRDRARIALQFLESVEIVAESPGEELDRDSAAQLKIFGVEDGSGAAPERMQQVEA
jgi:hypothetical protein